MFVLLGDKQKNAKWMKAVLCSFAYFKSILTLSFLYTAILTSTSLLPSPFTLPQSLTPFPSFSPCYSSLFPSSHTFLPLSSLPPFCFSSHFLLPLIFPLSLCLCSLRPLHHHPPLTHSLYISYITLGISRHHSLFAISLSWSLCLGPSLLSLTLCKLHITLAGIKLPCCVKLHCSVIRTVD